MIVAFIVLLYWMFFLFLSKRNMKSIFFSVRNSWSILYATTLSLSKLYQLKNPYRKVSGHLMHSKRARHSRSNRFKYSQENIKNVNSFIWANELCFIIVIDSLFFEIFLFIFYCFKITIIFFSSLFLCPLPLQRLDMHLIHSIEFYSV